MSIFHRSPRTRQELAANFDAKELGFKVRGKRLNLPTNYDDISREIKNGWKENRATQYRATEVAKGLLISSSKD